MDFSYDIVKECSLQTMATVIIVRSVLESSGLVPHFNNRILHIPSKAANKVDQLMLPEPLKTGIKALIRPIMMELTEWYIMHSPCVRPVLNLYGTLDLNKSILTLLQIRDSSALLSGYRSQQRSIACWQTYFDQLQNTESQICSNEDWATIIFSIAVENRDSATIKLFCDQVSQSMTHYLANRFLVRLRFGEETYPFHFPPSTFGLVFSRMSAIHQREMKLEFSESILISLLKWPYQHLFLEAAKTLAANISDVMQCEFLIQIALKALYGYKDHDYTQLFIEFWALSDGRQRQSNRMQYIIGHTGKDGELAAHLILLGDDRITALVLDGTSEELKARFLEKSSRMSKLVNESKEFEKFGAFINQ